jgi:Phosphotransferase enzyme family
MTSPPQDTLHSVGDAELFSFVRNALAEFSSNRRRLSQLERKLYDYHSSFAIEELVAYCDDESPLNLIFKNLSPHGLLEHARQTRPQFAYNPSREIMVYRHVLDEEFDTATCYGALVDADRQRHWLLLEKVAGQELYKIGDFTLWCDVARWLAQMHGRSANVATQHPNDTYLLRYDEAFWNAWIDRAERFIGQGRITSRRNMTPPQMKWLVNQSREAAQQICNLPVTILHGEFYPSNILIQQRDDRTRICPIDWETAAVGCGLLDLAALIAGNWTEQQKQQLAMAYYKELSGDGTTWDSLQHMMNNLQSCRLLLAVKWLGWSPDWRPPAEHRFDWLDEAMNLAPTIAPGSR